MDKNIKAVLEAIEGHGFEAYVVGGYVRDYVRGIITTDIDICTNALPKDISKIFNTGNTRNAMYGAYKLITDKYNFDITTYRKELKYTGRKPTEIEYVNNLLTDIERRDFTINSLCMNSSGEIIDLLNGEEDIKNKKIKVIGDVKIKLTEDPLRMLRAIRFGVTLDYLIDPEIIEFIINNKELINTLSNARKKYEIDCILVSPNAPKGLELIKDLGLCEVLGINYDRVVYTSDLSAMWAQINVVNEEIFTKEERFNIKSIKEILSYGKLDNHILFKYGLYLCSVAGSIINIDIVTINEMFKKLPITNIKDIKITSDDIISILDIKPSPVIKKIFEKLATSILNGDIINEPDDLKRYILLNKVVLINEESSRTTN